MPDLSSVFASIGIDRDYSDFDSAGLSRDLQGWGSDHPIFGRVFDRYRPQLVVEVGVWKGASVLHMARLAEERGLPTQFVCVDTWLGSSETIWMSDELRPSLGLKHGYPSMFRQFLFNVIDSGAADRVFPLPMTSSAAYYTLKALGVRPDAIYIDGSHKEAEVAQDLALYYDLLQPGGVMFGDDYAKRWIGVCNAVNRFAAEKQRVLETGAGKWLFEKGRREAPDRGGRGLRERPKRPLPKEKALGSVLKTA